MTDDMPPLPYQQMPGSDYTAADMHRYARRYALLVLMQIEDDADTYREVGRRVLSEIERLRGAGR
jgi:hypothetical protein